jgi:hypothetical protein
MVRLGPPDLAACALVVRVATSSLIRYSAAVATASTANRIVVGIRRGRHVKMVLPDRRAGRTEIRPMPYDLSLAPGPV